MTMEETLAASTSSVPVSNEPVGSTPEETTDAELLKKQKKQEKKQRQKERKLAEKEVAANDSTAEPTSKESTPAPATTNDSEDAKRQRKAEKRKRQKESKKLKKQEEAAAVSASTETTVTEFTPPSSASTAPSSIDDKEAKKKRKAEKRKRQNETKKAKKQEEKSAKIEEPKVTQKQQPAKPAKKEQKSVEKPVASTPSFSLNTPMKFTASLYDEFDYYCNCCPVELTGYEAATNHVKEFEHYQMSVVYNSLIDSIKCQCCGNPDLSILNVILINPSNLSSVCTQCLASNGYDNLIHSLSSKDTLLKYIDNMYHLVSLKCFSCDSQDDLAIDDDLTCYCSQCISKDTDLQKTAFVKRSDIHFLAKYFEDVHYDEFKNRIELPTESTPKSAKSSEKPATTPASPAPAEKPAKSKKKTDKKETESQPAKKDAKPEKGKKAKETPAKKDTKIPTEPAALRKNKADKKDQKIPTEPTASKKTKAEKKKEAKKESKEKEVKKDTKSKFKESTPMNQLPKQIDSLSLEDSKIETKFEKLKAIVKATLPEKVKLTFDNLKEHNNYLSYSLFLEELYTQDICKDVSFEWNSPTQCTMTGSTKTWFDMYVNDDVRHLKKHPFVRDQPIFIIRKSDADLNWTKQPDFWLAYVSSSTLARVDRKGKQRRAAKNAVLKKSNQVSSFELTLYPWNDTKFPTSERGDRFAFLPGSTVVGRILNAMNNIENKAFINLILGKEPIKMINFNNKIGKYFNVLNDSQKDALQSALNNTITILQGPPGSGKTSTIYEIILQLLTQLHYYPILVVAASNLAVDNIAEKLMGEHKDIILRITSISKEKEYGENHPLGSVCLHNKISKILPPNLRDIEQRLKRNASSVSSSEFSKYLDACSKYGVQMINQANIIFATTAGIAGPLLKKIKKMPVIIMDEATQSSEPSTLIPLGAQGCTKVILVGDTAQLSVFTRVKSLEMSLFQRVLENGSYNNKLMLDTQYRMHPDISHFSREKFYDGKLKDGITADDRKMKNIKYPVYFFNHQGTGASESKLFSVTGEEFGFSWVNKKEVNYIERIVEKLIVDYQIPPKDIGIMTGYAAQRDLIVKSLEKNRVINPNSIGARNYVDKEDISEKKNVTVCNVNGIIIATIDAFQGREMNFVLMSCVRSNDYGNIGFMSDKRRMNVALTRAKYSFIMCGDAECMSSSPLWKDYIKELNDKGYVKNSLTEY